MGAGFSSADQVNLFEVFKANGSTRSSLVRKSKSISAKIRIYYGEGLSYRVDVFHGLRKYVFYLMESFNEDTDDQLRVREGKDYRHTAWYTYRPGQSSLQNITSRLLAILNEEVEIELCFDNTTTMKSRGVSDLVNFANASRAHTITILSFGMTSTDFNFIAANFPQLTNLRLIGDAPKQFRTFALRYPRATVSDLHSITFEDMRTMDSTHLVITKANFTSRDFNKFIFKWINFHLPSTLTLFQVNNIYTNDDLWKDLEPKKWQESSRTQYFEVEPGKLVDFSGGSEIFRCDGKLASILSTSGTFLFVVWHSRFPNPVRAIKVLNIPQGLGNEVEEEEQKSYRNRRQRRYEAPIEPAPERVEDLFNV